MQHRFFSTKAGFILPLVMLLVGALAIGSSPHALAHGDGEPHPAHIHAGTCAELGDVVAPLSNVSSEYLVDGTVSAGEAVGPESAIPVEVSVTTVALPLADIIAGGHAINIHESEANIGNYIACGDIGGTLLNGNQLPVGLGALNDSGYTGVAMLTDDGNGNTTVTVSLIHSSGDAAGGETAADDSTVSTADGLSVSIKDFLYSPEPAEVTVGQTITWTNEDGVPHTATQKPSGSGFQSSTIASGESFSFTFETAGTFEYFCEFHPNMVGTVIVSE